MEQFVFVTNDFSKEPLGEGSLSPASHETHRSDILTQMEYGLHSLFNDYVSHLSEEYALRSEGCKALSRALHLPTAVDLKASNIRLRENLVPGVCELAILRPLLSNMIKMKVSDIAKGDSVATEHGLGMPLVKMLEGKKLFDQSREEYILIQGTSRLYDRADLDQTVDPGIRSTFPSKPLIGYVDGGKHPPERLFLSANTPVLTMLFLLLIVLLPTAKASSPISGEEKVGRLSIWQTTFIVVAVSFIMVILSGLVGYSLRLKYDNDALNALQGNGAAIPAVNTRHLKFWFLTLASISTMLCYTFAAFQTIMKLEDSMFWLEMCLETIVVNSLVISAAIAVKIYVHGSIFRIDLDSWASISSMLLSAIQLGVSCFEVMKESIPNRFAIPFFVALSEVIFRMLKHSKEEDSRNVSETLGTKMDDLQNALEGRIRTLGPGLPYPSIYAPHSKPQ